MQIASSDEYLFANDQVAFRVIERLDGRFWLQSAITPENGCANSCRRSSSQLPDRRITKHEAL